MCIGKLKSIYVCKLWARELYDFSRYIAK